MVLAKTKHNKIASSYFHSFLIYIVVNTVTDTNNMAHEKIHEQKTGPGHMLLCEVAPTSKCIIHKLENLLVFT